ncbi:ABC transporter permease [Telmatocola sphagniphila]|uniref:ABC transporter permease n=1 Tax=Telmatocola sphagniphila TaxID=1123043 RepID=A0A8E6B9I7_9BACT|nr:ABC transporter permease [Telmatocola sphagniphila]QVL32870.1 ABC transporter permease [Telmatocola sphagniphila]
MSAEANIIRSWLEHLGDWAHFSFQTVFGIFFSFRTLTQSWPVYYEIGVRSVGVVVVTGMFIGMVLALEAHTEFHPYGLDTSLGAISITSILGELGPVLAAVMLAGRVGSAMAAEIGTMRITDQTDALTCLGVNPIHYLSTPRLVGCLILVPMLTLFADLAGIVGSTLISTQVLGVDAHHYWQQTLRVVVRYDLLTGLIKSIVFGAMIALISCYQGFQCKAGAQGVGRAATQSFVLSFLAILFFDFLLVYLFAHIRPFFVG